MDSKQTEKLSAYLDGELSAKVRQEVEAWLAANAEARAELEMLRAAHEDLRTAKITTPDVDTQWLDFEEQRKAGDGAMRGSLVDFPKLGAVAAIVILSFVVWFSIQNSETTQVLKSNTAAAVELVESDIEDSSPIVYLDDESGWIVVWVEESNSEEPLG